MSDVSPYKQVLAAFKPKKYTSPKGTAVFPRLNEPDTKYKPEGEYTIKLKLPEADAKPLMDHIDETAEAVLAACKSSEKNPQKRAKLKIADKSYVVELAGEEGEEQPTGYVIFGFKSKASGISAKTGKKWERKPPLFDAKGKPLAVRPAVGGGSVVKVSAELVPFCTAVGAGVSLRLEAVQIVELRSYAERNAGEYGFGEEEGGFTAADQPENEHGFGDEGGAAANEPSDASDF